MERIGEFKKIHTVKGVDFLFQVETSEDPRDYLRYEELRNAIWGDPKDNLSGSRNMMCENFFYEGSSLFISVYILEKKKDFKPDKKNLVGFSYGFVGVKNKKIAFKSLDNIQFYSQYTGVRKDFFHYALGILIKEFQREALMDIFGISTVTCTYDPLTGVNAYRNIHHFGMDVVEYREAYYGEFGGLLNRVDIPCDRFFISWDLKKKIQRPEYDLELLIGSEHMAIQAGIKEMECQSGTLKLEVIEEMNLDLDCDFILVEIPCDFYRMLGETDIPEKNVRLIPFEWRMKTRQAFKTLFEKKYRVVDFRQFKVDQCTRNVYILKK